jgi:hypothetical protein
MYMFQGVVAEYLHYFAPARFCVALTFLVVTIQVTEIFPTELRSSGSGFVSTMGSISQILGPTIVYMVRITYVVHHN